MNLKQKLLDLELEFSIFKDKHEKRYILYLVIYFLPVVGAIYYLNTYQNVLYENIFTKVIILTFIIAGLAAHFYVKSTYYKTNQKYKTFLSEKLENFKSGYNDDEEYKKDIISAAKEIYQDKKSVLSNISIKNSIFWYNIFIVLGIELESI